MYMRSDRGFTLIELLTVIALIGILASLSISGFHLYKASAAYAVAAQTLHDARNALEASIVDQDNLPPPVPLSEQVAQGVVTDPLGKQILLGLQVPKNMKIRYAYDPDCVDSSCPYEAYLQANHCYGNEYSRWVRFGDGVEVVLEHVAGAGCP